MKFASGSPHSQNEPWRVFGMQAAESKVKTHRDVLKSFDKKRLKLEAEKVSVGACATLSLSLPCGSIATTSMAPGKQAIQAGAQMHVDSLKLCCDVTRCFLRMPNTARTILATVRHLISLA
jgi:hypothetical protein